MTSKKVMITIPNNQLRVIDGLVRQGAATTRSGLIQRLISAFIAETNHMRQSVPQPYTQPPTIGGALEALIAYFLYSLGKTAIDDLFGGN